MPLYPGKPAGPPAGEGGVGLRVGEVAEGLVGGGVEVRQRGRRGRAGVVVGVPQVEVQVFIRWREQDVQEPPDCDG